MALRMSVLLAVVAIFAGCSREPDFDQRYEEKAAMIRDTAKGMERETAAALRTAETASRATGQTPAVLAPATSAPANGSAPR